MRMIRVDCVAGARPPTAPRGMGPSIMSDAYEFGPFRLDLVEHRLRRGNETVPLTPKTFEVLAVLVSRAGHLVTRSDLLAQVWSDAIVEEANLSYCISVLRKALGDDVLPHRYIETIPKVGYRFVCPASAAEPDLVLFRPKVEHAPTDGGSGAGSEGHGAAAVRRVIRPAVQVASAVVVAATSLTFIATEPQRLGDRDASRAVPPALEAVGAVGAPEMRTRRDFDRRRLALERAIEADPSFARAHASLSSLYVFALNQGLVWPPEAYAAARAAAMKALRLNPEAAESHAAASRVALIADWDWNTAEAHVRRAVELNATSAEAQSALRYYLSMAGRHSEAWAALQRWRDVDPIATNYPALVGWHFLSLREYGAVIDELDRLASANPDLSRSNYWRLWRAVAFALSGRPAAARDTCLEVVADEMTTPRGLAVCGFVFGRTGDRPHLDRTWHALRARSERGEYLDPFLLASIEAGAGERDSVFGHLRRAADEHSPLLVELINTPFFDTVQDDPRYRELVSRVGFPQARPVVGGALTEGR